MIIYRQQRRRRRWRRRREHVPTAVPRLFRARGRGSLLAARLAAAARAARQLVLLALPTTRCSRAHLPAAVHTASAVGCLRLAVPLFTAAGCRRRSADAGSLLCPYLMIYVLDTKMYED